MNHVILITGASSGIGAATARALAAPDTAIALHAHKNREGAERVAKVVREAGGQALVVEGDLAKPDTARRLVDETASSFGQLDIVVSRGIAHLWGVAPSNLVRKAYLVAVENVPGVKAVEMHMQVVPPSRARIGL